MKLPNGYGSIYKMPGKRRKPFAVVKTSYINGKRETKYLAYFETKGLAIKYLSELNSAPKARQNTMTFEDLFYEWYKTKEGSISESAIRGYKASYKQCLPIHRERISNIEQNALQALIDRTETISAKRRLYYLLKGMYDYAEKRDYISRNRVQYLDIPPQKRSTKHRALSEDEVKKLWEHKENENVAAVLCLIYTGCRPMELFNSDKHEDYIEIQKGKTENAKRIVPIHDKIIPLMQYLPDVSTSREYRRWVDSQFNPTMLKLGIECTPYDMRHTFATRWAEQKLDEAIRCKIQGHTTKGIGQKVYTHYSLTSLKEEMNKLK